MKGFYLVIIFFFIGFTSLKAQEVDTVAIHTEGLNIKLKRNPLPTRTGVLEFKPVVIKPAIIDVKMNYWKTKTSMGINLNQAAFSNNWNGGGVNSLALTGLINYKAEYAKESFSYVSEVILNYDNGYAYTLDSLNQEHQTLISKFMAPGYLTESLGFEYRPSKYFSTRIGTGTARQTFVLDTTIYHNNINNFGVPIGSTFKNELAFQIVSAFEKEIFHNLNLKTRYMIFVPYDKVAYTNHRLDVEIRAKVNRFMNVTLTGVGLYDRNTAEKIQGSQTLALGLMFEFPR
jgi:hypothetical protein